MPAAAAIPAIVGAAGSLYSANRQGKAGRDAANQQQAALDAQMQAQQAQLDFAKEQYNDWRSMFRPVAEDLKSMAYEKHDPDYAAITADVGAAFDTSQDINRRQQQRYGFAPSDGAVAQGELSYGLGRAQAMVNARNQARTANQDQQYNRMMAFYSLGSGGGQAAASMVNAANQGIANAFGQQAGMYGNQSMNYRNAASGSMGDAIGAAGYAYGQYMNNRSAAPIPISEVQPITVPVTPPGGG